MGGTSREIVGVGDLCYQAATAAETDRTGARDEIHRHLLRSRVPPRQVGERVNEREPRHIPRRSDRVHRIAVIDGPNMSNLGARSKKIYGTIGSLADLQELVRRFGEDLGVSVESFASNYEGAILEFIHESAGRVDGYIINPAGLTTVGEAVRHALEETERPVVEVHFANLAQAPGGARGLRGGSITSSFTHAATGIMMGLRQYSYVGALTALVLSLDDESFLGAADEVM